MSWITFDAAPAFVGFGFGTAALPALAFLTVVAVFCFFEGPAA